MQGALVVVTALVGGLVIGAILRILRLEKRLHELGERLDRLATGEAVEAASGRVVRSLQEAGNASLAELRGRIGEVRDLAEAAGRREPPSPPPPAPAPPPAMRVAEEIEPLLRDAVESLDGRLREVVTALGTRRDVDLSEAVTRDLLETGFRDVRILDGPVFDGERTRFRVEARREGMTYKGPVFVSGMRVVEQRLSPAYPMFP